METRRRAMSPGKNMSYEIEENLCKHNNSEIESVINNDEFFSDFNTEFDYFDQDNFLAQQMDYFENYNVKTLHHIANYYKIQKNKVKKELLVQNIIEFENNPQNSEIVYNRKKMWHFINELKGDDYFSKFVFFTT